MPISRGWIRCVECGGIIPIIIRIRSASFKKAIFTWLECPSTIRSLLERLALALVAGSKTFSSQLEPSELQLHPFFKAAK
jgi:hypothetical protein